MTTAGTRAVVNTGKGKMDTDLKKSRWVWRPKGNYLDHVSKDSGSFMLKKSRLATSHMTGNKAIFQTMEGFQWSFCAEYICEGVWIPKKVKSLRIALKKEVPEVAKIPWKAKGRNIELRGRWLLRYKSLQGRRKKRGLQSFAKAIVRGAGDRRERSGVVPLQQNYLKEQTLCKLKVKIYSVKRSNTLIDGLRIVGQMGVKNLQANVDSRLVANQVNGTYVVKEADMIRYLEKVKALTGSFKAFSIKQIPKSENKKADALSKIASTSFAHLSKQVLVKELKEKSISEVEILAVVEEEGDTWMTPLFKYLAEGTLPAEVKKARAIRCKSWRFGLPGEIISDNGKLFRDDPFKDWCEKLCIHQHFASIKHPQTNGLVERANRSLGEGIKASNRDTPFSLTYGTEVVIPAKIGMPTLKTAKVDLVQNNEALEINLDLLEERREEAAIRKAKSKEKMEKYYNAKVQSTSFKPGDLVYRNNDASRAEDTGKLGPKWE
ncbi:reverse transcriptase domain-containing protein [Tanacetum coccineum]